MTQNQNKFPELEKAIRQEHQERRIAARFYILNGYRKTWAEEHRNEPDRGIKEYSTATRWEQYQNGTIAREKAADLATARAFREIDQREQKELDHLATVAAAYPAEWFTIGVHWVRSKIWGYNPTATVTAEKDTTEGHASGCGYDKESAAVAQALNQNPAILHILYSAAETALQNGYNLPANGGKWGEVLGYGCGYDILPAFEGGCGCSCYRRTLETLGYIWRTGKSTDTYNGYTITKGGAKE